MALVIQYTLNLRHLDKGTAIMNDTPKHVQDKQFEIWLAKSPEERLRQTLEDNDDLFNLWKTLKKSYEGSLKKEDTDPSI